MVVGKQSGKLNGRRDGTAKPGVQENGTAKPGVSVNDVAKAAGKRQGMKTHCTTLQLLTRAAPDFIDITDEVVRFVEGTGVQNGFVVVFSRHTTAAVVVNENEPLLLEDMKQRLEAFAPRHDYYRHNDFSIRTVNMTANEPPNGHAHCQHLLLGSGQTLPIINGRACLGRWQSVFFLELDSPREREVVLQVLGE